MTTAETVTADAGHAAAGAATSVAPTMARTIEDKITAALAPGHLQVLDESGNHNVPKGSEKHFKLVIVSSQFEGLRTLHRHRMVYAILERELATSVHALALHTYTDDEWREVGNAPDSPKCSGGTRAKARKAGDM